MLVVCVWCVPRPLYADTRGGHQLVYHCSIALHLIPLRQGLSLNLDLHWHPASHSALPVSAFHSAGIVGHAWLSRCCRPTILPASDLTH